MGGQECHQTGRAVIVLGMHRSGTSCLAGSLHDAGLHMADANTAAAHNAKGNRENLSVRSLNDRVLKANGGSWRAPPERVTWPADLGQERDALLKTLSARKPWGFKDPRTLMTLDGWLDRLTEPALVATYRRPVAVAASLHKRNRSMAVEEGLQLWTTYNKRLMALAARRKVHIVCFDWPFDRYLEAVISMAAMLGLPRPARAARFHDPMLRHQAAPDADDVPAEVARTYRALQEMSG